ncbi:hypothetical protein BAUCODRAFT_150207 [Baudoinia panamericana UAMH 10762]|uniref:Uncharacterized protein n=1 Tax=Baudoinia panamericana (strain UAMH 10762) TaxID=717646 RepID=M2LII2_BAUPA|nr:uncharacterized protein BAUCODRAFT_150207 [Baudoinia panamericana UAMH 10762]EMC93977.1 hypothetical protein BAUCODRAFT_150207 [Baudoinia panamericana UAMH 10762]
MTLRILQTDNDKINAPDQQYFVQENWPAIRLDLSDYEIDPGAYKENDAAAADDQEVERWQRTHAEDDEEATYEAAGQLGSHATRVPFMDLFIQDYLDEYNTSAMTST